MNVIIIEDEEPAVKRLEKLLKSIGPDYRIVASLDSIEGSVNWLSTHDHPDLMLMDIHLADGSSFDIFRHQKITCPIIFITAYDEYAVKAFKVNGIDYLLKPIKKEELRSALDKFEKMHYQQASSLDYSKVAQLLSKDQDQYIKRLVVHYGQNIRAIEVEDVAYFYTEEKVIFLCTKDDRRFSIDLNLDKLENTLNPKKFFRINRQFIVNIKAIEKMLAYSKSRVKILLNPPSSHETITSVERSSDFKKWLAGE
ncbi:MAG: response regulator transcription factor [Chitinophagales bacterium]|nr:response regulator transcription factor [Chitinophagales bacterium]